MNLGWLYNLWTRIGTPAGADIATDIAGVQADTTAIVADTNELQGDWADGGRLDLLIDELTTQGDTNETNIATVDGIVDDIKAGGGFGSAIVRKTYTFSNTAANSYDIFSITGDVIVSPIAVCATSLASGAGANIQVGIGGGAEIIVSTLSTDLIAREIWHDVNPDAEIEDYTHAATTVLKQYIVTDGNNIQLTLDAQVDSGAIIFYCFWTALSTDGAVTAAA